MIDITLDLFPAELLPVPPQRCPYKLLHLLDRAIELKLLKKKASWRDLHQWFLIEGYSPAAWRLLVRYGADAFPGLQNEELYKARRFTDCLNYVEWQARAGLRQPLPAALGRPLQAAGSLAGMVPPVDLRLIRAAANHWPVACAAGTQDEFAKRDWPWVLAWMRDHKPTLDSNQWRSGWPLIWREYQKLAELENAQGEWEPGLNSFVVGPFTVTPLSHGYELVHDGWKMNHCASVYVSACRAGKYRIFSVTLSATGKRVATIGLKRRGSQWKLDQMSGRANCDPGPRLQLVGELTAVCLAEREWLKKVQRMKSELQQEIENPGRIMVQAGLGV